MFFTIVFASDNPLLTISSGCNPSKAVLRVFYLRWNQVERVSAKLLKPFC